MNSYNKQTTKKIRKRFWGKLFEKVNKDKKSKDVNKKILHLDSSGKVIKEENN